MIFRVTSSPAVLDIYHSKWDPKELDVEGYIMGDPSDEGLLATSIFHEDLLIVHNQIRTRPVTGRVNRKSKRADILALDRRGSAVIVELKRHAGTLGVDMQALQYLADFSISRGRAFIERFKRNNPKLEVRIRRFLGADFRIDDINRRSRVILVARQFEPALFSMGEWLSGAGVAFRCIEYTPFEVGNERFLSFSVAFDRSPDPLYPVAFRNEIRDPACFWHNIGDPNDQWWDSLKQAGEISASFQNQPGDEGERLLKSYVPRDNVVAYAKGFGAVGWGTVEGSYRILDPGDPAAAPSGRHLHRLSVKWNAVAPQLRAGIPPDEVRTRFGIFHPLSTSVRIADEGAQQLLDALTERFRSA